ncbi:MULTISPECIES: thiamine phosphate synthase [Caballeronia]|uniref:thiamine phosphate synthase n=1 Tax=Caballeronia TaxID=1827195 RepID=UPI00045EF285|nr:MULTISPECIES: thiamine phosphate synthase [unclassified Caballeronia]MCE4543629.1 thiamine phosphate synthase [Caballeronia sp. PC1]MCE4567314.1 thiamine phosphate synthase [Caballeronia sp. CLC5]BAO87520.1 thiamine-phosphate synthase [Burkholderia sp. RPE67]BBP97447.1 thiamine phosphate synthase [Burkholderia sp. SFA1]
MSMLNREVFWPPADELTEVAERIRARLGAWPAAETRWRVCLTAPEAPSATDLIVFTEAHDADTARLAKSGAAVLDAHGGRVTLRRGGEIFALEGEWSDDWLAALAAFLDCNFEPHDALTLALAWRAGDENKADAWPVDFATFPRVADLPAALEGRFPVCPDRLGLYPVLPSAEWVERVLDLGVCTAQLRRKTADAADLQREIARSVEAGRRHDAQLFINDHWREAIAAGAYGVHLGQEDVQTADLAAIAKAGLRLGLSTHGYFEMLRALHFRPSYLALGAVYPTTTKVMPTKPQGLERLARYVQLLSGRVPLVAIGGIDAKVMPDVLATGVGSAAVVRAVTEAPDTASAVSSLRQMFACQR